MNKDIYLEKIKIYKLDNENSYNKLYHYNYNVFNKKNTKEESSKKNNKKEKKETKET